MTDVAVVIVTYNSGHQLGECLAALDAPDGAEVYVIDNCSGDGTVAMASSLAVAAHSMPENVGYGRACNYAASLVGPDRPWIVFMNPDVRIRYADLLRSAKDAPPAAGAVSPLLRSVEGSPLRDLCRPPHTAGGTVVQLASSRLSRSVRKEWRRVGAEGARHVTCAVTSGACLLVRRPAWDALGGFDERFFFNGEDIDLCMRLSSAGYTVVVDRHVEGLHYRGTSAAGVTPGHRMFEYGRSLIRLSEIHGRLWHVPLVSTAVLLGIGARALGVGRERAALPYGKLLHMWLRLVTYALVASGNALRGRRPLDPASSMFMHS